MGLEEMRERHGLKLDWKHTHTRTGEHGPEGEVYDAQHGSNIVDTIRVRVGRHPGWPRTWHMSAESGNQVQRSIAGEEPSAGPLMKRLEAFAERWALAGSMPNVL